MKNVAQDVAEAVFGAAKDGGVKVSIVVSIFIFQRQNLRPTHACRPPRYPWATREGVT